MTAFNTPAGLLGEDWAADEQQGTLVLTARPNFVTINWGGVPGFVPSGYASTGEGDAAPVSGGTTTTTPAVPTKGLLWPRV